MEDNSSSSTADMTSNSPPKRAPRVIDQIGDRMKGYENAASLKLDPKLPFIVRIDGHHFSKFTKGFKRPFDTRIANSMRKTTEDLVQQFNATTGYTQSDEITLIFPPCGEKQQVMMFGGKIQKISSLMASFASVRFNFYMNQCQFEDNEDNIRTRVQSNLAFFDARAFNVPDPNEALNNLMWRSVFDCRRNSISNLAFSIFPWKAIQNLGTTDLLKKLKDDKQVDWEDMPPEYKYGNFVKKEMYEKETLDPTTNSMVKVMRSQIVTKSFNLVGFSDENLDMIFRKYW